MTGVGLVAASCGITTPGAGKDTAIVAWGGGVM